MGQPAHRRRRVAEGSAPGFWAAHHNGELTMLVAALAIVLVTAVLGGFREAAAGIVERAPGQSIDLGSLAVVVTGATLSGPTEAAVSLRVTNRADGPRAVADLRNVWLADGTAPLAGRAVDPTIADLNPGLPVEVVVRAPVAGWVGAPSLTLVLRRDPPAADPLTGQRGDQPGTPVARVTVDVQPAS